MDSPGTEPAKGIRAYSRACRLHRLPALQIRPVVWKREEAALLPCHPPHPASPTEGPVHCSATAAGPCSGHCRFCTVWVRAAHQDPHTSQGCSVCSRTFLLLPFHLAQLSISQTRCSPRVFHASDSHHPQPVQPCEGQSLHPAVPHAVFWHLSPSTSLCHPCLILASGLGLFQLSLNGSQPQQAGLEALSPDLAEQARDPSGQQRRDLGFLPLPESLMPV